MPLINPPSDWGDLLPREVFRTLANHQFLFACRSGAVSTDLLARFLVQHRHYSQHFPQYLCALMSNIPKFTYLKSLGHNLLEELGFNASEGKSHAELYIDSMKSVGAVPNDAPPLESTSALINAMFRHCRNPDPVYGLAALCLGAEAIVPILYEPILIAMKSLRLDSYALAFFETHISGDEEHAIVMKEILMELIGEKPKRKSEILAVGNEMIKHRIHLLDELWDMYDEAR